MKLFNIEFAPLNIPLERRMQTLVVLVYVMLFFQCLSALGAFLFAYTLAFSSYFWLSLMYAVWYYMDFERSEKGGRTVKWVRHLRVWHYFRDYFPVRLVKTCDLDPTRNYLMCISPHGVMCFGTFVNFATEATGFSALFPGLTPHLLTLQAQFVAPLMRELFMLFGSCSASAKSIRYILGNKGRCRSKGQVAALLVGGAAESLESLPGRYRVVLRSRKGFVRLALETGASLVPVFSFGENEVYNGMIVPDHWFLKRVQNKFKEMLSFALPIIWGRGIFNYNVGLMPHRRAIHTVIGRPIDVARVEHEPSDEQVQELHARYVEELTRLFEENKSKYVDDWKNAKLEIL